MKNSVWYLAISMILVAVLFYQVGWTKAEGLSDPGLEDGRYDIIRVVGADPVDSERTEMVVNRVNQCLVHRFVSLTPDCFSNYDNTAKLLVVTDGKCYWLSK